MHPSRRSVLATLGTAAVVSGLAGCSGADSPTKTGTPATESPSPSGNPTTTGEGSGTPTADLDLREANVVGVSTGSRGGEFRFSVTLHHDDPGESGYANWWQIERLDGTRLGRRDLLHAHDQQPFTRSATIEIPEDVSCVVARGHDQTHGYGGRAMAVDVETGATNAIDQGPDPRAIDASDCPAYR